MKAEVDKTTAYKGEQIIVSYYLYHQSKIFNIQVDKFPVLSGFLREDLEMPVMKQRLESEHVVLNGVPYERSLLARYAAYPLEAGKLNIDSISLKYNYYGNSQNGMIDQEDPFFGFFQQLAPRVGTGQSEKITMDVLPLPEEGRPASFGGGIGDFSVASAINKYEVHANEAVTLTVKVEGRGNVSNIHEPKAKWPESIELYDTKGRSQGKQSGLGGKVFEFLLIPRQPGKVSLPALEFGFFDPVKKKYYTRSSEPVQLTVLDPVPGTALVQPKQSAPLHDNLQSPEGKKSEDLRYLKPPGEPSMTFEGRPIWRYLYWAWAGAMVVLVGLLGMDAVRRMRGKQVQRKKSPLFQNAKAWDQLHTVARSAQSGASWQDVRHAYDTLSTVIFDSLDRAFPVGVKAISRSQLKEILVGEKGLSEETWKRVEGLLEFSDLVRFASSAGAISESKARTELSQWVKEGEKIVKSLEKTNSQ